MSRSRCAASASALRGCIQCLRCLIFLRPELFLRLGDDVGRSLQRLVYNVACPTLSGICHRAGLVLRRDGRLWRRDWKPSRATSPARPWASRARSAARSRVSRAKSSPRSLASVACSVASDGNSVALPPQPAPPWSAPRHNLAKTNGLTACKFAKPELQCGQGKRLANHCPCCELCDGIIRRSVILTLQASPARQENATDCIRDLPCPQSLVDLSSRFLARPSSEFGNGCTIVPTACIDVDQSCRPFYGRSWRTPRRSTAQRTLRGIEIIRLLGHRTGGRSGEHLAGRLGLATSKDTILRHLKRDAGGHENNRPLRVIGIDEWVWRKGHRFGTTVTHRSDVDERTLTPPPPPVSRTALTMFHNHVQVPQRL